MDIKPHINGAYILQKQHLGDFLIKTYSDIVSYDDKKYKYIVDVVDKKTEQSVFLVTMEKEKESRDNYHIVMYKNEKSKRLYGVGDVDYEFFITDARNILIDNVPEFSNPVWIENQRSEHHEFINNVFFGF